MNVKNKPPMKEAQVQKDEPIVHARLRDLLEQEKMKAENALRAARESRSAFNLQIDEVQSLRDEVLSLRSMVIQGHNLISRSIWEMDHHTSMCPFARWSAGG